MWNEMLVSGTTRETFSSSTKHGTCFSVIRKFIYCTLKFCWDQSSLYWRYLTGFVILRVDDYDKRKQNEDFSIGGFENQLHVFGSVDISIWTTEIHENYLFYTNDNIPSKKYGLQTTEFFNVRAFKTIFNLEKVRIIMTSGLNKRGKYQFRVYYTLDKSDWH